jgi:peptide-methionine (S)-S-oxide reductase
MKRAAERDELFRRAVSAIDAGDVGALEQILVEHPNLVDERLDKPGAWLRDTIGGALDGFFEKPYLLWFVAEDPRRAGKLPPNIAEITRTIIQAARREHVKSLQVQLDRALQLVAWSGVAADCGVQLQLIDVLADAGASLDGIPDNALVNGHVEAAAHLVQRGAPMTLSTALCLERWDDVQRLFAQTSERDRQMAFILAALNGRAPALERLIGLGIDVNRPSQDLYAHATALHHAVGSGSLEAVRVLVESGAGLNTKDTAWGATPAAWAQHYLEEAANEERVQAYSAIIAYLRGRGARDA